MGDIKEILKAMAVSPRGVGHTHAMLEGASAGRAVVICHTAAYGDALRRQHGVKTVPISQIGEKLKGLREARAYDNYAIEYVASTALKRIYELEEESRLLTQTINSIKRVLNVE